MIADKITGLSRTKDHLRLGRGPRAKFPPPLLTAWTRRGCVEIQSSHQPAAVDGVIEAIRVKPGEAVITGQVQFERV